MIRDPIIVWVSQNLVMTGCKGHISLTLMTKNQVTNRKNQNLNLALSVKVSAENVKCLCSYVTTILLDGQGHNFSQD